MTRSKPKKKGARDKGGPEELMRSLHRRMEKAKTAEALNDEVIIPFMAALEDVSAARGYVLNIYGEGSNVVVGGDEADAEAIYGIIEEYLNEKGGA